MPHCRRCDALMGEPSHDGLCGGCSVKQRIARLSDPYDKAELHKRLLYLYRDNTAYPDGICPICKLPFDEHSLTYSPVPTARPMCASKGRHRDGRTAY